MLKLQDSQKRFTESLQGLQCYSHYDRSAINSGVSFIKYGGIHCRRRLTVNPIEWTTADTGAVVFGRKLWTVVDSKFRDPPISD